ncbi:ABC transporter permease [Sporosarcina jiandibaonis]|uniref:ABC transporter permease n=1 Tax=Sporosarcina jiandibaonis TaxID=2715535 RepID=UPI0015529F35|nr:ABC transporter permease [Sporosarcina jiandibaonis]
MKNLRELWGARFIHYMTEFQKYMKYVFTGHLALVLVFAIGAGGYTYSEWLKEVSPDFPSALLAAIIIGAALTYSSPVTLLKPADSVYFLPLETKLHLYFKQSLRWSIFSQLPLPFILYIVALPLLSATETGTKAEFIWLALFIVALKWIYVETEFYFRHAKRGDWIWGDRVIRFIFAMSFIYIWLGPYPYLIILFAVLIGLYSTYWRKQKQNSPFPYEHFITIEQNRMMRFYRFANYFTDVPHLKGSVSRRQWLGFFLAPSQLEGADPQKYLVKRTFIRTDDIFWLWVRLTVITLLGAVFIPFPLVVYIFTGALSFASAIQIIYALRAGEEFRMDMLFPLNKRPEAIRSTVRQVQWLQALFVMITALFAFGFGGTPFLLGLIIIAVSEITLQTTKEK